MKKRITTCLWFNTQAEEAANFYTSLFENSGIEAISRYGKEGFEVHGQKEGTVLTVAFQLSGTPFTALNGGPQFAMNPSISFYVRCQSEAEVDFLWKSLLEGGSEMMPLDTYPWSAKYGWLNDRFDVSWQIALDPQTVNAQKITPALLFMGDQHAVEEDAITFYTSVFPGSGVDSMLRYTAGENEREGSIKHAQFSLGNNQFMMMGNSMQHEFDFNEAISFQVLCDTQDEIDYYWQKLSEGGSEWQCGWLKDKYGISWQVVPSILESLLTDPEKAGKVIQAFMPMKKFIIEKLLQA
jgi:predicted 3-demethylubiquinone-9 3-methyltransferase (glyoxalase superfamily)